MALGSLGTLSARVALDTTPLSAGMKTAGLAFAAVAAGAAAAIYKVGSDYETSLNTFQAVSKASAEQMRTVGATAKQLGADMTLPATSAADAAKAMTELAKAGLSVSESMSAAKGALQLAAAAGIDEGRAAEIAATALNAFGLKGSEAGRVADLLAGASASASGEITDMADALKMSSAVFAAGRIPIEDLVTGISLLAKNSIIGSDAGTSLKQMLLSLENPSKITKGVMKEIGLSIYDTQGKMVSFREIIERVTKSTKDLTEEQRNAALGQIFGSDAVRAMNVLIKEGATGFDQMKVAVTAAGSAQEIAAAKSKGLKGALDGLKSQLETVAISIYEKVSPALEGFVRRIADAFPLAIEAVKEFMKALTTGFTEDEGTPVEKFALAIRENVLPILAAAVAWVKENWPEIKTTIVEAVTTARDVIVGVVDVIRTVWENWGELIMNVVGRAWEFVVGKISGSLEVIRGVVDVVTGIIHGDWGRVWEGIKEILHGVWEQMKATVQLALSAMGAVVRGGLALIVDAILGAFEWIVRAAASAFDWVPGIGPKLRDAANRFENFRDDVNASLLGIQDKDIYINTYHRDYYESVKGQDAYVGAMAEGGLVEKPTFALIGEAGRELVLPLTNMRRTFQLLSQAGLVKPFAMPGSSGAGTAAMGGDYSTSSSRTVNNFISVDSPSAREIAREIDWRMAASGVG